MESFRNFEHKFAYSIIGHSGDSPNLEFVKEGKYPKTEKDVFKVISQMSAHSQYCLSGDNTLSATSMAMREIVKDDADDYIVVVLSDANIGQYNIKPEDLARILRSDDRVTSSMIFIGSLADQADKLKDALGSHAHVCLDTKDLPQIIKSIFLSSMIK
ncbi:von Willebrand factor A domain-containing protein 8 [Linnemannia elongata]|nr:von Willebrand factor A domain-containing protein 8 [Linnemannia elongata]